MRGKSSETWCCKGGGNGPKRDTREAAWLGCSAEPGPRPVFRPAAAPSGAVRLVAVLVVVAFLALLAPSVPLGPPLPSVPPWSRPRHCLLRLGSLGPLRLCSRLLPLACLLVRSRRCWALFVGRRPLVAPVASPGLLLLGHAVGLLTVKKTQQKKVFFAPFLGGAPTP